MESAGALGYLPGFAPEEAPLGNQEGLGMLPGFAPVDGTIIPGALVQTWAAGGGKMVNRGRGAPVPLRIWFGLLTSLPHEARKVPGRKRLEMTLRDLRDLIYYKQEGRRHHFNPKRDIARMRGDLWEVDQIRIRTMLPGYKAPGLWRPVGVTLMPEAHLDSPIVFDIELPPGSVGGAMIGPERHAILRREERASVRRGHRTPILLGQVWHAPQRHEADPGNSSQDTAKQGRTGARS